MTDTGLNEQKLIKEAAENSQAFGELVMLYQKKIYSFALGMLSNPEDAFDVSQETFLKAYRSFSTFKGQSSFYTWLYAICRNCCYDFLKSKNIHNKKTVSLSEYESQEDGSVIELPDNSSRPDVLYQKKYEHEMILDAINSLPLKYREIIIMRDINDLSYEEIAALEGTPVGTVKSRLNRARAKLQQLIADKIY